MSDNAQIMTLNPGDIGLPDKPITPEEADTVVEVLGYASNRANVLGPLTQIDFVPAGYVLSLRVVLLPLDGMLDERGNLRSGQYLDNGLWHKLPGGNGKPDKVSMEKSALDQIASAAGCTYLQPKREDDGQTDNFWRVAAGIRFRTFDGSWREVWDSVEYDLRDGAPEARKAAGAKSVQAAKTSGKPWEEHSNSLREARRFGWRLAVSKARNRAIRAAFGIRPLEVWEAQRPFVFPVLQWMPDMSNPEIAKMVAAAELGLVDQVYGGSSVRTADQPVEVDAREPAPAQGGRGAPQLPPPEDDPFELSAEEQERINAMEREQAQRVRRGYGRGGRG